MTEIQQSILDRSYRIKPPKLEKRFCEHKVRCLAKVQYYDLVVQHALMQVTGRILDKSYYYESAASIKGRGIHYSLKHVRKFIDLNKNKQLWWAQLDFVKCYHHINRQKLYDKVCKEFADEGIRYLFHEVIWALGNHNGLEEGDGSEGVGIGLYPVQPLVDFYLNDLDRVIRALQGVKYFRYADNLLFVGYSPDVVQKAIDTARNYVLTELEQPLHTNVGIQKLDDVHPIDFVGYLFYYDHTKVRKDTKYRFKRTTSRTKDEEKLKRVLSSYKGWLMHCNGLHLWQTVTGMKRFSDLNIQKSSTLRDGKRYFDVPSVSASFLVDRNIIVKDFEEGVDTTNGGGRMCVLVEENGSEKKFITNNPKLKDILTQVRELGELPFEATLRCQNLNGNKRNYYFE